MKATVEAVDTAVKTREEVMEEMIMEWQHLNEALYERIELDRIASRAEYFGLNAYDQAKSALSQFGLESDEYRAALRRLFEVFRLIRRAALKEEQERRKLEENAKNFPVGVEKYEELFIPKGVTLPEVTV